MERPQGGIRRRARPRRPVSLLVHLAGVGPPRLGGTGGHSPGMYPFFDELVAQQMPGMVR